jgi:ribosome-associated protein
MKKTVFQIQGEFIELNRLLKAAHICQSGGEAGYLATSGEVRLNGVPETRKRAKIRKGDKIEIVSFGIEIYIDCL